MIIAYLPVLVVTSRLLGSIQCRPMLLGAVDSALVCEREQLMTMELPKAFEKTSPVGFSTSS